MQTYNSSHNFIGIIYHLHFQHIKGINLLTTFPGVFCIFDFAVAKTIDFTKNISRPKIYITRFPIHDLKKKNNVIH